MIFYISVITMEVYLGRSIKKEGANCLEIFPKDCLLLKKDIWYLVEHVHNIRYSACVGRIVFRSGSLQSVLWMLEGGGRKVYEYKRNRGRLLFFSQMCCEIIVFIVISRT